MSTLLVIAVIAIVGLWIVASIFEAAESGRRRSEQERKQKKLEYKRQSEEAIRIVREGAPELAALRNAVTVLRDFAAHANAYRPKFIFPRDCERSGDGPDPEPWVTTVDNLLVPKVHELRSIYTKSNAAPPEYPRVELSLSDVKVVTADTQKKFLIWLRKLWTGEAQKLEQASNQLQSELAEQKRKAEEARD